MIELKPMWKGPMDGRVVLGLVRKPVVGLSRVPWHFHVFYKGRWVVSRSNGEPYPNLESPYEEHPIGWIENYEYDHNTADALYLRDVYERIIF